eukprot:g9851.t1
MSWYATTIDNSEGADKIKVAVRKLGLEPIVRTVFSHFWWDGKLDHAVESRIEVAFSSDGSDSPMANSVKAAIAENHSDDVPMLLTKQPYNELPALACYQLIVTLRDTSPTVADAELRKLGKTLVEKRLAGCTQHDNEGRKLFVKTTAQKLNDARDFIEHVPEVMGGGSTAEVKEELVEANEDYWTWLHEQTESEKPMKREDNVTTAEQREDGGEIGKKAAAGNKAADDTEL